MTIVRYIEVQRDNDDQPTVLAQYGPYDSDDALVADVNRISDQTLEDDVMIYPVIVNLIPRTS